MTQISRTEISDVLSDGVDRLGANRLPTALHCIPTLGQGGAERMLVGLCDDDRQSRHAIVTIFRGEDWFEPPPGVTLYRLSMPRSWHGVLLLPYFFARFLWILFRESPTVIVGWLYYGALFASAGRLLGYPVIWSLHAAQFDMAKAFACSTRAAIRASALLSSWVPKTIHYCSEPSRATHEAIGFSSKSAQVIENGVDLNAYRFIVPGRSLTSGDGRPVILCVARFAPQKDHGTLFAALAKLKQRDIQFRLILAGAGCVTANSELQGMIQRFGLDGAVELLGLVSDMPGLYERADAVVLSSSHGESMPLVVLEAMAASRVVIATDVGDCREMIGDAGMIVPPSDAQALSDRISEAISMDPERARSLGNKARQRIESTYSMHIAHTRWQALLRRTDRTSVEATIGG